MYYTGKFQGCASLNTPYFAPEKHGENLFLLTPSHKMHATVISSGITELLHLCPRKIISQPLDIYANTGKGL